MEPSTLEKGFQVVLHRRPRLGHSVFRSTPTLLKPTIDLVLERPLLKPRVAKPRLLLFKKKYYNKTQNKPDLASGSCCFIDAFALWSKMGF